MAEAVVAPEVKPSARSDIKEVIKDVPPQKPPVLMSEKLVSSFVDNPKKVYNRKSYVKELISSQMKVSDQCSALKRNLAQTERELQEIQRYLTMTGVMRKPCPIDPYAIDSDTD